ncbi:hypothetical protein ABR738_00240 [Streptomyces sp. Edi4]|uniref:hypothetical protein n=1 Tax=Streptomyces sp. Edi4 TaxID=3162527 RepID=UPI0033060B89
MSAVPPPQAVAADAHWSAKLARLRARKAAEVRLTLWQDADLREAFEEARRAARSARRLAETDPDNKELAREARAADTALEKARAAHDADAEVLVFRALPGEAFTALVKEHPPSEEQAAAGGDWDEESFPPALIAASSADPMTEEDAALLLSEWGPADRIELFQAALAAQNVKRADWGKDFGLIPG